MPGGLPYQPWLATLVEERTANQAIDDPHIRCLPDHFLRAYRLPHYLKFVQTPDLLVMLNEYNGIYRQVFTDGRPLPEPESVMAGLFDGHMVGQHVGDRHDRISRRPVDRLGRQHDYGGRKDSRANPAARLGRLEIEVTVDDPKSYTKPWSVTLRQQFAADTELIDEICAEGEKFAEKLEVKIKRSRVRGVQGRSGCIAPPRRGTFDARREQRQRDSGRLRPRDESRVSQSGTAPSVDGAAATRRRLTRLSPV